MTDIPNVHLLALGQTVIAVAVSQGLSLTQHEQFSILALSAIFTVVTIAADAAIRRSKPGAAGSVVGELGEAMDDFDRLLHLEKQDDPDPDFPTRIR